VAEALSEGLAKATAAIRENEPGSRDGGDIEHVHQMRVATRRIRAYLKAAKPALDPAAADRLRADLSELAGSLGEVRDLDVMIDRMHSEAAALGEPDTAAFERLIGRLETDRRTARARLLADLDDPAFGAMLTELDEAAEAPPVADPWADLKQLAGLEWERLARARAKLVTKFGAEPPDDDLHALRIYGKRARYAAELLTGSASGGGSRRPKGSAPIRRYLVALSVFQEVLGNHQDACVLEDQLRLLVADSDDTEAALAAGRVIEGCRERCVQARLEYPDAWDAVRATALIAFD
jgi:CHAD domain-containing protein